MESITHRTRFVVSVLLFLTLAGIYRIDRIPGLVTDEQKCETEFLKETVLPLEAVDCNTSDDSTPNLLLAHGVVNRGSVSLSALEACAVLEWRYSPHPDKEEPLPIRIIAADETIAGLTDSNQLSIVTGYYKVVPRGDNGRFVNTFGAGAGLTAVPLVWLAQLKYGDIIEYPGILQKVGAWTAAISVAGSGVFVFLTAAQFVRLRLAILIALCYGLGTCVYSTSSQTLVQHGPTELFLAAGVYFLGSATNRSRSAVLSGLAFAAATWCRPTSVVPFLTVATYLLIAHRKALVPYLVGGVPLGLLLMLFNATQYGSPFRFGQTELAVHALEKTGSPEIWQTPVVYGAVAALLSPSRGLFVYSPFLLFCLAGGVQVWRDPRWSFLRPIAVAVLVVWMIEFRHFDWWGGWSFGYRHLVDTVALLIFLLIPVMESLFRRRFLAFTFCLLVIWSIGVQGIGTFLYDRWGWNARMGYIVKMPGEDSPRRTVDPTEAEVWVAAGGQQTIDAFNIDRKEYRDRLWSVWDSQLLYYLSHPLESYFRKQMQQQYGALPRKTRLAETYDNLGLACCQSEAFGPAETFFQSAVQADPNYVDGYLHWLGILSEPDRKTQLDSAAAAASGQPTNVDLRLRLIVTHISNGDLDGAKRLLQDSDTAIARGASRCLTMALARLNNQQFRQPPCEALRPTRAQLLEFCRQL